jgi:GNAT superfamily N-acetyltransferase
MPRIVIRPRTWAVSVQLATLADVSVLATLAPEFDVTTVLARLSRSSGTNLRTAHAHAAGALSLTVEDRIERALSAPDNHVLIATLDREPAGLAWCTVGPLGLLGSDRVIHIEQFHVTRASRRRGVGRALLQAVASLAETHGAEAVTTWTGPQDREVNRYFARLGFAPLAVRRLAPVTALRRALVPAPELTVPFPRATEALRRTRRRAMTTHSDARSATRVVP